MGRFNDEPDVELIGRLVGGSPAAFRFAPDFGSEDEVWIPRSQADWIPDPDRDDKGGVMLVRAWLAKKNGWDKA